MISVSFLTEQEADAVELARVLNQERLLCFDVIEDHTDLLWEGEQPARRVLVHLSGFTKALLYTSVERKAREVLGDRLIRMWAMPVTSFDARSTQELMGWLAKA